MTIRVAQGTVSISSALTAGTTINITTDGAGNALTGFHTAAKRAVIFSLTGNQSTGFSGALNMKPSFGFATGTTARRAYSTTDSTGTNPADTNRRWRNDACIMLLVTGTGAVDGLVDYNGEVTDGFQLIVDDQLSSTRVVAWFAIWGDELTHAINDFTSPAATGNQDYNVGLNLSANSNDDKGVIIIGGPDVAVDTASADSNLMLGLAAGNTPANAVLFLASQNAVTPSVTWGYCRGGECVAGSTTADTITERAGLTQWNADGWRLNWTEVNGTAGLLRYSALTLKGPRLKLFDILSRTDTTQTDEVVGFDPLGIVLISHARTESSSDTATAPAQSSVGFGTGATSRSVTSFVSFDNLATSDSSASTRTDALYANLSTSAETALLDIVDMSAPGGGFTFVMDDTDASAAFIAGLAVGAEFSSAPGSALHETSYMMWGAVEE